MASFDNTGRVRPTARENLPSVAPDGTQELVPQEDRPTDVAARESLAGSRPVPQPDPAPRPPTQQPAPPVQVVVSQNVNQQAVVAMTGVLRRNWVAALVLAILLGWLGVDSFYLGQPGKGVLKLFTLGLFGILWLIDTIMIATKSVRGVEWV